MEIAAEGDASLQVPDALRELLASSKSCVVYGPAGVGKTYALHRLLPKAIRVELGPGDMVDRLVATIAGQTTGAQAALKHLHLEDVGAALEALEDPMGGCPLVVDRCERFEALTSVGLPFASDAITMLTGERTKLLHNWLRRQSPRRKVVVLWQSWATRAPSSFLNDGWSDFRFKPQDSVIPDPSNGCRVSRWKALSEIVEHNPAALRLLGLSLPLAGSAVEKATDTVLENLSELPPGKRLEWVASKWFPRVAGDPLRTALSLAARLPGAPEAVLEAALLAIQTPPDIIATLRRTGLVEERNDGLWVMRAIEDASADYTVTPRDADSALRAAAQSYLERVPDRSQPTVASARWLFEAHRLFLEVGDAEEARRTAHFHVGGLIELARQMSVDKEPARAATLYADIDHVLAERLEEPLAHGARDHDDLGRLDRLRSYVLHYKHYNRHWAKLEGIEDTLQGYRSARGLWPDNALWYAHEIAMLFEQGRERDALELREQAYRTVPDHPRRDELLTGRAAVAAFRARRPFTALELLSKMGMSSRRDLALAPSWSVILDGFTRGVEFEELPGHGNTRVSFLKPVPATLKETGDEWFFKIEALEVFSREDNPLEAIQKAGDELAASMKRLVFTHVDELTRDERKRKVFLQRHIDLLGGELGLHFRKERWLLGRIEGLCFVPVQRDFESLTLPEEHRTVSEPDKLWFARVGTFRDGRPTGEILELTLAGDQRRKREAE